MPFNVPLQLLLGVARLVPAPAYFPLRLRCARALNRLGEATGTFIPVAPILLEVLQWGDLRKAPKAGTGQHPDVLLQLRVSKANMRSTQYQEEVVNQVGAGVHVAQSGTTSPAARCFRQGLATWLQLRRAVGDGAAGRAPGVLGLPHRLP